MANIQCKMCGGVNELQDGVTSGVCQYCGSLTTFPKISDEQTEHLYSRAEHFRQKNDFDKAVSTYESILNRNSEDPEAYWGLVLSRYGIEYVEDPATHERIPTCHRVQYESILADSDYQNALKFASGSDRDIYEKEANRISEIQKDILRISSQEKPYDVFICYKETTDGGTRTKDSTLAQDIYYQLTNQGLKVFFARITLEDKLGQQYEPYIFAALNSAKVMLVIGSKREYFDAVWVKNEWSRFLALMKKDRSKLLIPCYRDMDAYDIPEELSMFQSQDMSKIGFIQDILRGIMKVVNAGKEPVASSSSTSNRGETEVVKMMKRISVLMRQKEWDEAQKYCKKALDIDPENAELYVLMSMIGNKITDENELRKSWCLLSDDKNFQVAVQFASPERKKQLEDIRTQTLVNYYLHECLKANGLSSEKDFVQMQKPLSDDEFYQKALNVALPEQKKELQKIQEEQAELLSEAYLKKCITDYGVPSASELSHARGALSQSPYFQKALEFATPKRREELQKIQEGQAEYFLQQCMTNNQISCESDLPHAENPLVEDEFFQKALECASQKRQEELQKIQEEQVEYFLQLCITANQISCEADLSHAEKPLAEDEYFQKALECAPQKRQEELQKIQEEQVEYFLQKSMEDNCVSSEKDLSHISKPLSRDRYFQLALKHSKRLRHSDLWDIQCEQEQMIKIRLLKRFALFVLIIVVILGAIGSISFFSYRSFLFHNGKSAFESENYVRAGERLSKAVAMGHSLDTVGQRMLGRCYEEGNGVKKDLSEAVKWFRKAADQGDAKAQLHLGGCYYDGDGVTKDFSEAVKWFRKAADQGDATAQFGLGLCYENGTGVTKDLAEAVKWYRKAAEQGEAIAQFNLANSYYNGEGVTKDLPEAVKWFRKAADQGNDEAQFILGNCYVLGNGVTRDYSEALNWYRKAAKQGNAKASTMVDSLDLEKALSLTEAAERGDAVAQNQLGEFYFRDFITKDYSEGVKWFRKAAEQGDAAAQRNLGICYGNGYGVSRDLPEAVKWYRKAADQGDAVAQFNLGTAYFNGDGVEKDLAEAVKWYRKAADQGNTKAQVNLGACYENGNGVTKDMSEATKWFRKAAEQGDANAQFNLANRYYQGEGVPQDKSEAMKWWRKAADQGHAEAQFNLGVCYFNGEGVSKYVPEAVEWWRKAADQGHAEAQFTLGSCYETGLGVPKDLSEAVKWYRKAADQGNANAQRNLGLCYVLGNGVTKDLAEAVKWYRKAADQGDAEAQYTLGSCYESGLGVPKDLSEAVKWYRKAAEQGNANAQVNLGACYEYGNGIPKDLSESVKWYRKAADQGNANAKEALFRCEPVDLSNGAAKSLDLGYPGGISLIMVKLSASGFAGGPGFYIGQTEVTQAQWRAVMRTNPSHFKGDSLPVEQVSWYDAMAFCKALNDMGKAPNGWKFTLPTESQWEYAAYGATTINGYKYSGSNSISEVAWYKGNSGGKTHLVGQKKANGLGLYDMTGNVWEWCLDNLNEKYKDLDRASDSHASGCVYKGCSYSIEEEFCRIANSLSQSPGATRNDLGFRLALVQENN